MQPDLTPFWIQPFSSLGCSNITMFITRSLLLTILPQPCYCPPHCWQIRFNLTINPQQQSLSQELCTPELLPTHIPAGYWLWKTRWNQQANLPSHIYLCNILSHAHNAGVPRHLVMSIGIGFTPIPDAISEMIINEQIKVIGCRFASNRGRIVKRPFASIRLRVYHSVTPALINL